MRHVSAASEHDNLQSAALICGHSSEADVPQDMSPMCPRQQSVGRFALSSRLSPCWAWAPPPPVPLLSEAAASLRRDVCVTAPPSF